MTIRDFATQNNLLLRRDSAGDLIVPGRRTANDMPKQRDYANHVYDGFADDRLGICLLFTTRKKWTTTRRTLELAGCLLKQNSDTEGCLTFDPTNAEQVRAVVKAGGLKARRMASPERLVHLASARLRRVANPPIEDGASAARKHSLTQHTVVAAAEAHVNCHIGPFTKGLRSSEAEC